MSVEKVSVWFAVDNEINNLKKKDYNCQSNQDVYETCARILCTMVNKFFERNPHGSVVLLLATMFDANIVLNKLSKEKLTPCLIPLLKRLLELNILSFKQCDIDAGEWSVRSL